MTNLFPGATWVPVPGQDKRAARRKGRGVGFHVAVHEGPSIEKIDEGTGNDSHLYVRFDGSVEQNIDLDLVSYAMVDGNATLITVETEGGVAHPELGITADNQPWTDAQVVTCARILRWAHDTEGAPLQLMPDSKPTSQGACYHRQGIDPWRVSGGEVWSYSRGKVCPGAAKIAQLPQVLALAIAFGTPTPTSEEDDTVKYLAFRSDTDHGGTGAVALAAPGQWYGVPSMAYFTLLKARGLCGDWLNVPPNEFDYFRTVFLAPELNDDEIAAAVAKLSADEAARAAATHP